MLTKSYNVFRFSGVTVLALAATLFATSCATGSYNTDTISAEAQMAMTPDDVQRRLADGNARYQAGNSTSQNYIAQAKVTASGQYPMAFILSCVDSRVPPEAVFDCAVGDLFVGRVAGNVESGDMLGSMEFATKLAGAKLVVVLGHTSCGAVKGACDRAEMGNLTGLLASITPAVDATPNSSGDRSSKNVPFVNAVAETNVWRTIEDIKAKSPVMQGLIAEGKLKVVGAMYDIKTGRVHWLKPKM